MSSSKKMDFTAGVYLSEAQYPILPHPPIHRRYVCRILYFFTQERGGELNQREGERGNSSQS